MKKLNDKVLLKGEAFNKKWLADFLSVSVSDIDAHAEELADWVGDKLFSIAPRWYLGICEDYGVVVRKNNGDIGDETEKITYTELFKRLESQGYPKSKK